MNRAPKFLCLVLALICSAGILKASLPPTTIGAWTSAINLSQPRANAASALLPDGRILITGGDGGSGALNSAEFFTPNGTVAAATSMNVSRSGHFEVALSDGRVLVGGGISSGGGATNSAEIYDPTADSWTQIGPMTAARANASAALLQDGRVVIAGGDNSGVPSNTIEIFDPSTGNFSFAGTLSSPRTKQAMAVLQDGRVLIVGGFDGTNALASCDIFDPSSGSVSAGPSLATARYSHSATTLLNGQVVVIGGATTGNSGTVDVASAEIFDPATGVFGNAGVSLTTAREGQQAFLLPSNNSVLVIGGTSAGQVVGASELFVPQVSTADGSWSYAFAPTASNVTPRTAAVGSAMNVDGLLLVAGGNDASGNTLASTELYAFPVVKTDAPDYPPGTTVTISGSGFKPGEVVNITLVESPLIDTHGPYAVTADGNGNFTDGSFATDIHDVNVRFWLSAVGSQSGLVAENTFTDASKDTWNATPNNYSITLNPGQAIPTSGASEPLFGYTVTQGSSSKSSDHVTFNVNAGMSVTGATWASPSKTSISISSYTSGDSAAVQGTVPCNQSAGLITLHLIASLTNNTSVLSPNSMSNAVNIIVTSTPDPLCAVATTTEVSSSANPSTYGSSVTFTASITPSTATGSVQFVIDGSNFGSPVTVSGGTAAVSASTLSVNGGIAHTVQANYIHTGSFVDSTGSLAGGQLVNKANAMVVVTPYTVTYDGQPHTATVTSITGVNSETGATVGTVDVSNTTHTNAGTYSSDSWTFTGAANYNNISATTITDTINKANATVVVTPYTVTYDGSLHIATYTITGVSGETGATVGTVTLNSTHTNAGTYTADSYSFTPGANYSSTLSAASSASPFTDTISPATATVVVTPYTVTYDGSPHTATYAITGVSGETGATVGTVTLTSTHTNAGTYTADSYSFTPGANYSSTLSAASSASPFTDTINKATATVMVTPYNVTYDGQSHTATITSITGVNGETGATVGAVDVSHTTHINAQTYSSDYWTFAGTGNYNNIAATTITDTINKANATVVVTPYAVTYDGNPHTATVTSITGVNGETGATVGTVDVSNTTHTNPGDYPTDPWSFTGATNYNSASGTVHDSISFSTACAAGPGDAILPPINSNGSSVYKRQGGSTIPVKFRVCDASGNAISNASLVFGPSSGSITMLSAVRGTVDSVNETTVNSIADVAFRWDSSGQQWIFNMATSNLTSGLTYQFRINLANATQSIVFVVGVQ